MSKKIDWMSEPALTGSIVVTGLPSGPVLVTDERNMPKYANSSSRPVRKSRVTALTPRARGARKIEGILQEKARAPWGGMIGEKLIKPIGVLGYDLHGVRAVGLEDEPPGRFPPRCCEGRP